MLLKDYVGLIKKPRDSWGKMIKKNSIKYQDLLFLETQGLTFYKQNDFSRLLVDLYS